MVGKRVAVVVDGRVVFSGMNAAVSMEKVKDQDLHNVMIQAQHDPAPATAPAGDQLMDGPAATENSAPLADGADLGPPPVKPKQKKKGSEGV